MIIQFIFTAVEFVWKLNCEYSFLEWMVILPGVVYQTTLAAECRVIASGTYGISN